jgi:hypothetical protein
MPLKPRRQPATDAVHSARSLASPPIAQIASAIHVVRGQRVMLDADLATLYGVSTKRLNEQVRRNRLRFPDDFAFRLTADEARGLRSQTATSRTSHGGRRYAPMAFTEHGAVMLASVLNGPVAVHASIQVVRAFVQLRSLLATHADLVLRLDELERTYDRRFQVVCDAIRRLMQPPESPERARVGFQAHRKP